MRGRRRKEEDTEESEEEEEGGEIASRLNNLTIETVGTEEEAADDLEAALGMELEEDRDIESEEGGEGNQRALGALEFFTQDAEPSVTTIVDARNGFNELISLAML